MGPRLTDGQVGPLGVCMPRVAFPLRRTGRALPKRYHWKKSAYAYRKISPYPSFMRKFAKTVWNMGRPFAEFISSGKDPERPWAGSAFPTSRKSPRAIGPIPSFWTPLFRSSPLPRPKEMKTEGLLCPWDFEESNFTASFPRSFGVMRFGGTGQGLLPARPRRI